MWKTLWFLQPSLGIQKKEGTPLLQACAPWGRLPFTYRKRRSMLHLNRKYSVALALRNLKLESTMRHCVIMDKVMICLLWTSLIHDVGMRKCCDWTGSWAEFTLSKIYLSLDAINRKSWKAHLLLVYPGDWIPVEEKDDFWHPLRVSILKGKKGLKTEGWVHRRYKVGTFRNLCWSS